jgi:hypothetical protein
MNNPVFLLNLIKYQNEMMKLSKNKNHLFSFKVYGWKPIEGPLPHNIQNIQGIRNNKIIDNADVYVTCDGSVSTE